MFLSFLESNRDKNPQFLRKLASRIDSSFFAPLKKADQIASHDDSIASYHELVSRLLEIDPTMPCRADYEREAAPIESEKKSVRDRLGRQREEKRRIVEDEYNRLLFQREEAYKKSPGGRGLKRIAAFSLIAFVVLLVTDARSPVPRVLLSGPAFSQWLLFIGLGMGSGWLCGRAFEPDDGCIGVIAGLVEGWVLHAVFVLAPSAFAYLVFFWLALAVVLAVRYIVKLGSTQLTPQEEAFERESLVNIKTHFSGKEQDELTRAAVRILTTGGEAVDSDRSGAIDEATPYLSAVGDPDTGEAVWRGHEKGVLAVAFSPDGGRLAS